MVKKGGYVICVGICLLLIPLISAGFFSDFFGKLTGTGRATQEVQLNLTVGTVSITYVFNESMTDVSGGLNSGPLPTDVTIDFTAYHGVGASNLNLNTATINFTQAGETVRTNSSCVNITSAEAGNFYVNFTCNVIMWWWDNTGTWDITAHIIDINNNGATNDSTDFQVGSTEGFERGPTALSWGGIVAGSTNSTSNNDPIVMNNTGNEAITAGNIFMNSTNLLGETNNNYGLWTGNFSMSWDTGGICSGDVCVECAGTQMNIIPGNLVSLGTANLTRGNYTINNNYEGQEELYVCLRYAGNELTSQSYSTAEESAWTIQI